VGFSRTCIDCITKWWRHKAIGHSSVSVQRHPRQGRCGRHFAARCRREVQRGGLVLQHAPTKAANPTDTASADTKRAQCPGTRAAGARCGGAHGKGGHGAKAAQATTGQRQLRLPQGNGGTGYHRAKAAQATTGQRQHRLPQGKRGTGYHRATAAQATTVWDGVGWPWDDATARSPRRAGNMTKGRTQPRRSPRPEAVERRGRPGVGVVGGKVWSSTHRMSGGAADMGGGGGDRVGGTARTDGARFGGRLWHRAEKAVEQALFLNLNLMPPGWVLLGDERGVEAAEGRASPLDGVLQRIQPSLGRPVAAHARHRGAVCGQGACSSTAHRSGEVCSSRGCKPAWQRAWAAAAGSKCGRGRWRAAG